MADEAFEALWGMKAGPELIALHGMFGGATLPAEDVRSVLELNAEEVRLVVHAAERVGLVERAGERLSFLAFAPGSAQQGRLDWCLETHQAEHEESTRRLKTTMLVRYLSAAPGGAG